MGEWLSVSELSNHSGVSVTSIRRYISTFPEFFMSIQEERKTKYHIDAILVIQRIAQLYKERNQKHEIAEKLSKEFSIIEQEEFISHRENDGEGSDVITTLINNQNELIEKFEALSASIEEREKENKELYRQIKHNHECFIREQRILFKQLLMEIISHITDLKREILSSISEEQKIYLETQELNIEKEMNKLIIKIQEVLLSMTGSKIKGPKDHLKGK